MKKKTAQTKKLSVVEIVEDIKKNMEERDSLYEQYLEDHAIAFVDPVENNEFLLSGWSEPVIQNNEVMKSVKQEFSFFLEIGSTKEIEIKACITSEDPYLNPAELSLFIDGKVIGKVTIKYSHLQTYTFKLPAAIKKSKVKITGKVHFPLKKSNLLIRSIAGFNKDLSSHQIEQSLIAELSQEQVSFDYSFKKVLAYRRPDGLLPSDTKLKKFKKLILKIIKPYTMPQMMYNTHTAETIAMLNKRIQKLEKLVMYLMQMKTKV